MDKTESKQERQSNMELLRIVAMLLVLLVHVNYLSLGAPTLTEICAVPLSSFFRIEFEALALVCVNVFVLISGYFGIRPSFKGVAKFLFQIIFFQFVIYSGCVLFGKVDFSWYVFFKNVIPQKQWFVWAYLGLMLASPVLNAFVETVSKKSLEKYLIVFFVLQFATGWLLVFWNLWRGVFCGLVLWAVPAGAVYKAVFSQNYHVKAEVVYDRIFVGYDIVGRIGFCGGLRVQKRGGL